MNLSSRLSLIFLIAWHAGALFAQDSTLRVQLQYVATINGEMQEVMGQSRFSSLSEEQKGFFANQRHLKDELRSAKADVAQALFAAKQKHGTEAKIIIRASLKHGKDKEQIFELPASSQFSAVDSEDLDNLGEGLGTEITDAGIYHVARKVSKTFNDIDVDHQYQPVRRWYSYLAAKLGIATHDVFYGMTAAATIATTLFLVNDYSLDILAEGGFKFKIPPDMINVALTGWSAAFESATVLFSAFYIHWVNKGNLFLNRMKISTIYVLFPVMFGAAMGIPMNGSAEYLTDLIHNGAAIFQTDIADSLAGVGGRFIDGIWNAFKYVAPTHFVFASLGQVKSKLLQSSGNLATVVAANVAVFLSILQTEGNGFSLVDLEAWITGQMGQADFVAKLSEWLPSWLAETSVTAPTMMTFTLGVIGLVAYPKILYNQWKKDKLAKDSLAKTSVKDWLVEIKEQRAKAQSEKPPSKVSCFLSWFNPFKK